MKTNFPILLASSLALFFFTGTAIAGDQEKMVVALKTSDFEVAETDISELAIGEAKTILTDSGKTVDILRTENGVDIYVDGELMEMPAMDGAHDHEIHQNVEIECITDSRDTEGSDTDCDHDMMFISDEDLDFEATGEDGAERKVLVKRIHHECESDQQGECEHERVWVSDGSDMESHQAGAGTHKIVRIHKSHDGDENTDATAEKIIIIKKKSEQDL